MRLSRHTGISVLAAALLWSGPAAAAEPAPGARSSKEAMPASSRCLAACDAMEVRCEALEKEFPSCGTADICLEEKEQCQEKCGVSAIM